ncbi:hypothetical protein IQ07DRAFT_48459 [Pyrenochaeta sp. DS3sAY3a]|nr:hypothetical protein IQ07DRAFT_48459 [Pyrenochaeta sp. DS3sAY3a]
MSEQINNAKWRGTSSVHSSSRHLTAARPITRNLLHPLTAPLAVESLGSAEVCSKFHFDRSRCIVGSRCAERTSGANHETAWLHPRHERGVSCESCACTRSDDHAVGSADPILGSATIETCNFCCCIMSCSSIRSIPKQSRFDHFSSSWLKLHKPYLKY